MSSKTKTTATKEEAKPALVPKLRFPEFRKAEGWAQEPLGGVASFFKGKGLPKSALTPDGKRPCIHYGELFTVYPEVIGAVRSRTNSEEDVFLSVENDVLMPTSDVTPSGLAKACCLNSENVILGGDILVIRTDKRSINGEFLARYIRHLERKVLQLVSGSTVFHLYASSMEKLVLSFPPERAEQQKIAECLSSVDELIAAQARKVDALKTHKKGLMQQLFPREGEIQPRLRFPEFQDAGEWVEKPLSALIDLISGMHLSPENYSTSGEVPYFTGPSDFTNDLQIVTKWTKRTANVSQADDTLITVKGSGVGEIWYSTLPEVALGRQLMAIRSKNGSSRFVFQFLLTKRSRFEDLGSGNLIPGLSRAVILELEACFPSPAEQQRIADCLTSLDDVIAAHTQKLEALKTHKRGLMQQLFPSPEEPNP